MAVSNAPSSRRIRLSDFTLGARCVISLGASSAVVRCETRSSRQRRVGASSALLCERGVTCCSIVSDTWATPSSFQPSACIQDGALAICGHINLQITRSSAGSSRCVTADGGPVRGILSVSISTRTPLSNRQNCRHLNCRLNETFARVHDSFSLSACLVTASYRLPHFFSAWINATQHASNTALCCYSDWPSMFGHASAATRPSTQCHGDRVQGQFEVAGLDILKKFLRDPHHPDTSQDAAAGRLVTGSLPLVCGRPINH